MKRKTKLLVISLLAVMACVGVFKFPLKAAGNTPPTPGKDNFGISTVDLSSKKVSFVVGISSGNYKAELELYKGNKKVNTLTFGRTSDKVAVAKNAAYKYRVRLFHNDSSNNKVYSGWSPYRGFILPDISGDSKSKGIKLKFRKASGVTKYVIYLSKKSGSSGFKKVKTQKAKSKKSYTCQIKKNYAKKKTNYVRITPYLKINGYSGSSDVIFSGSVYVNK